MLSIFVVSEQVSKLDFVFIYLKECYAYVVLRLFHPLPTYLQFSYLRF